jgi:hypothetical protein
MRPERLGTLFFKPKTVFLWAKKVISPSRSKKKDTIDWLAYKPDVLSNGQRKRLAKNENTRLAGKVSRFTISLSLSANRQTPLGRPTRAVVFLMPLATVRSG